MQEKTKPTTNSQKNRGTIGQWIQQVGTCGKSVAEETQQPLNTYINQRQAENINSISESLVRLGSRTFCSLQKV